MVDGVHPERHSLKPQAAIISKMSHRKGELTVSKTSFMLENSTSWARFEGVRFNRWKDESGEVSVSLTQQAPRTYVSSEFTLHLYDTPPYAEWWESGREFSLQISRSALFEISFRKPISLEELFAFIGQIRMLVEFATDRACALLLQRILPGDCVAAVNPVEDRECEGVMVWRPVDNMPQSGVRLERPSFLFDCNTIPFEKVMEAWLKFPSEVRVAVGILMAARDGKAPYVESRLISAVVAAEGLHRALDLPVQLKPDQDFKDMRSRIVQNLSDSEKSWVSGWLRNQKPLRDRLVDLAGIIGAAAIEASIGNVDRWAAAASRGRNQLAHTGVTTGLSAADLYGIAAATELVVTLVILRLLGMDDADMIKLIGRHPRLLGLQSAWGAVCGKL